MNLFPAKTEHQLPDEIKKRLTGGLLISLLVHAFVLSLQFGLPGIGLPGLEVPWDKRRAETPEISVQIADVAAVPGAAAPVTAPITAPAPSDMSRPDPVAGANVKVEASNITPSPLPPVSATALASAVAPAMAPHQKSSVTQGIQLLAPSVAVATVTAPAPEKKTPTKAVKTKKSVTRIPLAMPHSSRPPRVVALDVPELIAQNNFRNDTFSVAVRDPEESKKELTQNEEQSMFPDPVSQSVDEVAELPPAAVSRFEPDAQQRERREEKILQATKKLLLEKIPAPASAQQTVKQMEEASRKQVAEAVRAEANAVLALKQQQEAERQQQSILQEVSKANASALAATEQQRIDNMKLIDDSLKQQMQAEIAQREQQRKERQTAMLTARQQAEEREEELRRQQEEALRKQQQMEMQIARAKNDELQERQKMAEQVALLAEQRAQHQAQQQAQQQAQEALQKAQQERLEKQRAESTRQQAEQALAQQREREQAAIAAAKSAGTNKLANTNDHPLTAGKADGGSVVGKTSVAGANNAAAGSSGSGDKATTFVLPQSLLSSDLANRSREQARGLDLLRGAPPLPRADAEERPRRRSVLGSAEKDIQLRMYIDSWKQKIERNGNLNFSQTSRDKARGDPVVTVAIRSDGSVEEITIHRSSGRADLDQAVRNIVRINARYAAFPPNIAAQYDVIEVRRVWNFDDGLRILEELR